MPCAAASVSASISAGGQKPGANPAATMPARAGGHESAHRGAVAARVGVGDVDPRQRVNRGNIELGVRRMAADRLAVERHRVAVGMAEHAEIRRAERLQAQGGGLRHLPRGMDLVVQHHQHAHAARIRAGGDADGVDQVHAGVAGQRAGGALRADQHHRDRHLQRQVEEIRGFLQRRGAVADDDAGEVRDVPHQLAAQRGQRLPLGKADRRAGDVAVSHGITSATSAVSGHFARISSACITLPAAP